MNKAIKFAVIVTLGLLAYGTAVAAPEKPPATETAMQSLYWQGHEALGRGDWNLALQRFTDLERQLRRSEPASADAAIYWQAYALARAGRMDDAVVRIKRLRGEFPKSRWNGDAARLLTGTGAADNAARIVAELKSGDEAQAEAALERLMSQPSAQAIPRLVALLQERHTPQFKKRALFVLSQIDDPGALAQVAAVARGADPALAAEALRMLGISGATDPLRKVYAAARDPDRKRLALKALGVAATEDPQAEEALAEAARRDPNPALRAAALQALGAAGGGIETLIDIAGGQADLATRREAIKALGAAGAYRSLLALYPKTLGIAALRDETLRSLLSASDERTLLDLYRKAATAEEKQAVLRVLQQAPDQGK